MIISSFNRLISGTFAYWQFKAWPRNLKSDQKCSSLVAFTADGTPVAVLREDEAEMQQVVSSVFVDSL